MRIIVNLLFQSTVVRSYYHRHGQSFSEFNQTYDTSSMSIAVSATRESGGCFGEDREKAYEHFG